MDCVFLLIAHWTTGRANELMAPSYGLLDATTTSAPRPMIITNRTATE
jgi:hypothetical protein